jgi:hypothetical protein
MRAMMVCVDYSDILSVTMPYNRHHFSEVCVVTSTADQATEDVARAHGCSIHMTDLFYARGAKFNKWAALEDGLDWFGREGWLCLMDADVLWPKSVNIRPFGESLWIGAESRQCLVHRGQLCTPLRRMMVDLTMPQQLPPLENEWSHYPIHRNVNEWAGYSQIFHASDPVLGDPPWHDVNWTHAGGADSFFQAKWPRERKVRPPFEVLHLGPAGQNWFGRATPRLDGTTHPEAAARRKMSGQTIWEERRRREAAGMNRFDAEKLK